MADQAKASSGSGRFSDQELAEIRRGFAERLREAFDGATNAEIARRLRATDATVKPYLDGTRLPIAEMLIEITNATGVNLHWLLKGTGPKRVEKPAPMFSDDDEALIRAMAIAGGRSFDEQVGLLCASALEFRQKVL